MADDVKSLPEYEVIAEKFWDGEQLQPKGKVVKINPEKVQVSHKSLALKPIGDAPVFKDGKPVTKK